MAAVGAVRERKPGDHGADAGLLPLVDVYAGCGVAVVGDGWCRIDMWIGGVGRETLVATDEQKQACDSLEICSTYGDWYTPRYLLLGSV